MSGLLQIFYEPGKVFDRVRERGGWLTPFIATVLVIMLSAGLAVSLIGMENIARKQLESNPKMVEQLGQQKIDQMVHDSNTPARKALVFVMSALGGATYLLVIAGLFTGLLSLMESKAKYKQVLGATAYAVFPFAVIGFVMSALILVLSNDRSELDMRNLIALNPGAFLNKESTSKPVYSLASSLDLLSFGQIAMISYGLSKVSGVAFTKCLLIVVVLWGIYVLGKAGVAAAF
ncbi:MAG: YIP1 family protein [Bryobacteraceae bacterium]